MFLSDIKTTIWKEYKSIFHYRGSKLRFFMIMSSPLIMGVYMPWDSGTAWLEDYFIVILLSSVIAVLVVAVTISDSFTGERERHTLSTLLASRLTDKAILFGKILFSTMVGWTMSIAFLAIGLITVNSLHGQGEFLFYSNTLLIASLTLSLLVTILTSSTGVIVSLKAHTTQESIQILSGILLMPVLLIGPIILIITENKPEWSPKNLLANLDRNQTLLYIVLFFLVLTTTMVLLATRSFQRSKLLF